MKLNKFCFAFLGLAALAFTGCKNEDLDKHHFTNKLYISSAQIYTDLYIQDNVTEAERTISVRVAKPASQDITVTFAAQPHLAAQYNMVYGDNAVALPAEHYDIPEKVSVVRKGDVSGNDIVVNFLNTNELDYNDRYVLPVTITNVTDMGLLQSANTVYFVFREGALINVVANIANMYFPISWSSNVSVVNMKTITVEALVRSADWEDGRDNSLSSLFGIENNFLIRIGDSDRPRNQLQFVNPGGNWPTANAVKGLPVNEWVHIAIVYDTDTGERIYYMNGKQMAYDTGATKTFSLNYNCYVGYSYNAERWLPGEISEMRIWNIQRTAEQIAANPYRVDPLTPGLIAYWKFNEGEGRVIQDHTGNGTTLTATGGTPKWVAVEIHDPNK